VDVFVGVLRVTAFPLGTLASLLVPPCTSTSSVTGVLTFLVSQLPVIGGSLVRIKQDVPGFIQSLHNFLNELLVWSWMKIGVKASNLLPVGLWRSRISALRRHSFGNRGRRPTCTSKRCAWPVPAAARGSTCGVFLMKTRPQSRGSIPKDRVAAIGEGFTTSRWVWGATSSRPRQP
jgi:hypothetical protein